MFLFFVFFLSWRGRNKQTPQLSQLSRVIGLESFLEVVAILDTVMPNFISVFLVTRLLFHLKEKENLFVWR